jgi:hypothetical protein
MLDSIVLVFLVPLIFVSGLFAYSLIKQIVIRIERGIGIQKASRGN